MDGPLWTVSDETVRSSKMLVQHIRLFIHIPYLSLIQPVSNIHNCYITSLKCNGVIKKGDC